MRDRARRRTAVSLFVLAVIMATSGTPAFGATPQPVIPVGDTTRPSTEDPIAREPSCPGGSASSATSGMQLTTSAIGWQQRTTYPGPVVPVGPGGRGGVNCDPPEPSCPGGSASGATSGMQLTTSAIGSRQRTTYPGPVVPVGPGGGGGANCDPPEPSLPLIPKAGRWRAVVKNHQNCLIGAEARKGSFTLVVRRGGKRLIARAPSLTVVLRATGKKNIYRGRVGIFDYVWTVKSEKRITGKATYRPGGCVGSTFTYTYQGK